MMGQVEKNWLWHRNLGHISFNNLVKISSKNAVRDIPKIKKPKNGICDSCQKGKQARAYFKTKEHHTSKPLELIHTDLCGPMRTQSINGDKYFMLFIDEYSQMTWVYFLKHKSKAFDMFRAFTKMIETQTGKRIKILISDRGGEFIDDNFTDFCDEHGIRR